MAVQTRTYLLFIILFIMGSHQLFAHPVIWKNGWVSELRVQHDATQATIHYGISRDWALGWHGRSMENDHYAMAQLNHRLLRKNNQNSQENLYVLTGIGPNIGRHSDWIGHLGVSWDWEDQSRYTQIAMHYYDMRTPLVQLSARVGYAPYVGTYDDMHTWLILGMHAKQTDGHITTHILPTIRLFKRDWLVEYATNTVDHAVSVMLHY